MKSIIKLLLVIVLISTGSITMSSQFVTGNIPATDDELQNIPDYEIPPTSKGAEKLPINADNSIYLTVGDQLNQGSCTAFAVSSAFSMLASSSNKKIQFSPYFIWDRAYYNELLVNGKPIEKTSQTMCSTWITDEKEKSTLIQGMQQYRRRCRDCGCGTCSLGGISIPQAFEEAKKTSVIPLMENYKQPNCGFSRPRAFKERIKTDFYVVFPKKKPIGGLVLPMQDDVITEIKSSVANKIPVVIGINTFFDDSYKKGDVFDVDKMKENFGYHAMTIVGYDDKKLDETGKEIPSFKIINSWGKSWGDDGYLWISYNAFKKMVKEVYAISLFSPEDVRPISTGQSLGIMSLELAYQPKFDSKNIPICLDVNTYNEPDPVGYPNEVIAYRCHYKENQQWDLRNIEGNKYVLKSFNNRYLSINSDLNKLELNDDNSSENAHWLLVKSNDNKRYVFRSFSKKNFVLGVDNISIDFYSDKEPTNLELNYPNGSPNQEWIGRNPVLHE